MASVERPQYAYRRKHVSRQGFRLRLLDVLDDTGGDKFGARGASSERSRSVHQTGFSFTACVPTRASRRACVHMHLSQVGLGLSRKNPKGMWRSSRSRWCPAMRRAAAVKQTRILTRTRMWRSDPAGLDWAGD